MIFIFISVIFTGIVLQIANCQDIPVQLNDFYCWDDYVHYNEMEIVQKKYDRIDGYYDFLDGMARAELNGKIGYIDRNGDVVIPLIYDDLELFSTTSHGHKSTENMDLSTGKEMWLFPLNMMDWIPGFLKILFVRR